MTKPSSGFDILKFHQINKPGQYLINNGNQSRMQILGTIKQYTVGLLTLKVIQLFYFISNDFLTGLFSKN